MANTPVWVEMVGSWVKLVGRAEDSGDADEHHLHTPHLCLCLEIHLEERGARPTVGVAITIIVLVPNTQLASVIYDSIERADDRSIYSLRHHNK